MPYAIQRSTDSGATFSQDLITTEDITLSDGRLGNRFYCIKDSSDNLFIQTGHTVFSANSKGYILKINKNGVVVGKSLLNYMHSANVGGDLTLSRDQSIIYSKTDIGSNIYALISIPISNIDSNTPSSLTILPTTPNSGFKFALYQDRYIWVASGSTVKIYNYETKAELASVSVSGAGFSTAICNGNNELFCSNSLTANGLYKFIFDGVSVITYTKLNSIDSSSFRQSIIDKWGDLVIITNTGTASTLLKYSTAGVKIGDTITLSGAMYNLNTDKDGNYYYSNAIGTYKVPKNTAQGQAIAPLNQHVKIRDNGMTTFGNNISGYNPAVFS